MGTKSMLFVLLTIIGFISCKPKHEELIDEYMKEHIHDYSSYEPVSFEVDTITQIADSVFREKYNTLVTSETTHEIKIENIELELDNIDLKLSIIGIELDLINEFLVSFGGYEFISSMVKEKIYKKVNLLDKVKEYKNKRNNLLIEKTNLTESLIFIQNELNTLDSIATTKPREIEKWVIKHKYRANNSYGALRLATTKFVINKDMTEIINSEVLKK